MYGTVSYTGRGRGVASGRTERFRSVTQEQGVTRVDQMLAATRTDRHEAICDAVFELLSEVGYDRMSMDAVAARARASKATIYRAWPNKPDLVCEALAHRLGGTPEPPATGSLRGDLIALATSASRV